MTAILILKVARELDIQIPQDLKVIGYDDDPVHRDLTHLNWTTIQQPLEDIAILMVDLFTPKDRRKKVATDPR